MCNSEQRVLFRETAWGLIYQPRRNREGIYFEEDRGEKVVSKLTTSKN